MEESDFDPFEDSRAIPAVPYSRKPVLPITEIPGQKEYLQLVDQCQELFKALPKITTREVDVHLQKIFETIMDLGPYVGVSRISIPLLRDCCGGKRVWKEELGWGLGDIVRRLTRLLGFGNCDGCERRRIWLNGLFRKRQK